MACGECGAKRGHLDGCPQKSGSSRASRRKGDTQSKPGDVILAAHDSDWKFVSQAPFRGKFVYTYRCAVSGCGRTGSSTRQGQKPSESRCPEKRKK